MSELLNVSNLSVQFAGRPILRDVAFSLRRGEIVSLFGPNGAGKTTLIRALLGQVKSSGTIRWADRSLSDWPPRELARRVAYLPQSPTSDPNHTVLDILRLGRAAYWSAFGLESQRDASVITETAATLSLTELLPRRMDELSGGQRQRVFLGRCLIQEPLAMLLDEPSTFLDLRHQVELIQLLRNLSRDKQIAVLMASHDLNLAAGFSDRLMLLQDGAIVASGRAADVLQPELLSRVYGVQINRIDRDPHSPVVFPVIRCD